MRICLLSREYPPDTGWGGIGAYTHQHAHGLQNLGHEVEVIALARKEICEEEPPSISGPGGIKVHRAVWGPLLEDLSHICLIAPYSHYVLKTSLALWQRFLKIHREEPFDVIEAPEHLAEGLFPALTRICPLVVRLHTPHSKFVQEGYHNLSPSFDLNMVANFERVAMLEADVLSSPSLDLAGYVRRDFGYNRDRVEIVRNPVDSQLFSPEGPKAIRSEGKLIVLFAGRLEERKGIYPLVTAIPAVVKACPDAKFVFVGADTNTASGGTSVLSELKASLGASHAAHAVQFVGKVPLSEMANYYRSADICVVPSLYDNAPYTVLEAMSCGKPIVASSAGGIPEYIEHEDTGLIVPTSNPDALAQALTALLLDGSKRAAFGARARERILSCFERQLIAKQALATYELAIERHKDSRESALYRKSPETVVEGFVSNLYSCHQSLSDLIYKHSWKLNGQRWIQLASHRPKLAIAKVFLAVLQVVSKLPFARAAVANLLRRVEAGVSSKEKEAQEKMRKRLFKLFQLSK